MILSLTHSLFFFDLLRLVSKVCCSEMKISNWKFLKRRNTRECFLFSLLSSIRERVFRNKDIHYDYDSYTYD